MRCSVLLPLSVLVAVTACVAPPRQPPAPAARPVIGRPTPPPAPIADWRDWPRTPGDWQHMVEAGRPVARYRTPAGATLFTMSCDRPARTLSLMLPGALAPLTIRTTSTTRTLATHAVPPADPATLPTIVATLAATDPLLDAMAFSRGRFTAEQPGGPPLVLPAWAEVGRLIEDCRG